MSCNKRERRDNLVKMAQSGCFELTHAIDDEHTPNHNAETSRHHAVSFIVNKFDETISKGRLVPGR